MVIASQLREGMAIRIEGQIYKVLEVEAKAGAGQAGGVVKTKLRHVTSGRMWEPHFRPDERLEELEVERKTMQYLYSDGGQCTLMDPVTFEQVEIAAEVVGPSESFLQPEMQLPVEMFEGKPISIVFPAVAEARIADCAPPAHAGQDSAWKEARLDNGLTIKVPLFIGPGELVRVDVKSVRYLERIRLERKKGA